MYYSRLSFVFQVPTEEKRREIDTRLILVDVNDTVAHVSWRHFSEDELQYIDGIQVRFVIKDVPVFPDSLYHQFSCTIYDINMSSVYVINVKVL